MVTQGLESPWQERFGAIVAGSAADTGRVGFPTESPICGPDDGLSAGLDGITFPAWCRESIKAYGNAIVPQVALRIFETINEYEKQ